MKKIYLFSVALMLVTIAIAQPNPPGCPPTKPGFKYPLPEFGFCSVNWTSAAPLDPNDGNWWMALVDADGRYIPKHGSNPPKYFEKISISSYSASIEYDCFVPGFVEPAIIRIVHVSGSDTVLKCEMPINADIIQPVKLTSFTGRLQTDNSVNLDWTSSMELSSLKYEIQRSADGRYFETIGELKAAGASITTIKYSYTDQLPSSGAYFYRLKQIDQDRSFEYSTVVYVNSKKGAGVITKIYPNPFKGSIQLVGATSSDLAPNNVGVYTISGQRIPHRVIGANSISIDPSAPDGIYVLKVKEQHFRIVKSKSAATSF